MSMEITISAKSFKNPLIVSLICLLVMNILSIGGLFLFWRKKYKDLETAKDEEEVLV